MIPKHILTLLLLLSFVHNINAQKTTQKNLITKSNVDTIPAMMINASTQNETSLFQSNGIEIKGFEKKLVDTRECFTVTNKTIYNISRIKLLLRYSDNNGELIHERSELIECNIPAGSTRQVIIPSFDSQRKFYYYLGTKPKRKATPFRAAFKLLRYDIIAE